MAKLFKQKDLYQAVADDLNMAGILPTSARKFSPHNIESYLSKTRRGLIIINPEIEKRIVKYSKQLTNVTIQNSTIA